MFFIIVIVATQDGQLATELGEAPFKVNSPAPPSPTRADMKAISSPIRIVPQTAQPIDFSCPCAGRFMPPITSAVHGARSIAAADAG